MAGTAADRANVGETGVFTVCLLLGVYLQSITRKVSLEAQVDRVAGYSGLLLDPVGPPANTLLPDVVHLQYTGFIGQHQCG